MKRLLLTASCLGWLLLFGLISAETIHAQTPVPLPDGDFEQVATGSSNWIELRDYSNRSLIVNSVAGSAVTPHGGSYFAWLGGAHNLDPSTQANQSRIVYGNFIQLPNETPVTLTLRYWIETEQQRDLEQFCPDVINVWINSVLVVSAPTCIEENTGGWQPLALDISSFAGQQIALEFEMRTDFADFSNVFIDDVGIEAGSSPTAVALSAQATTRFPPAARSVTTFFFCLLMATQIVRATRAASFWKAGSSPAHSI